MVGVLFLGVFVAVGLAYACTEYVMTRLDVRRRVMVGQSGLPLILGVNLISLGFLWVCAALLVVISGHSFHLEAAAIVIGAQVIWLAQHLWFYHRDHLRVHFEN